MTSGAQRDLQAVADTFRALAHPTRLRVLVELQRGERSPTELSRRFADPRVELTSLAYHVRGLASAGLVELRSTRPRRGAIEHSYGLTERGRAAIRVLESVTSVQ